MRARSFAFCLSLALLVLATPAAAQEGHPLKGSWLGSFGGPGTEHLTDVIVILDWDGKNITGMINPGTDNMEIRNATLNPDGWVLRFEATGESESGDELNYVIEGTLENLAFHNRSITGTWSHQNSNGPFELTRQ